MMVLTDETPYAYTDGTTEFSIHDSTGLVTVPSVLLRCSRHAACVSMRLWSQIDEAMQARGCHGAIQWL